MDSLSSAHLTALARAQQVLLAPLAYPTTEAWMQGVNDELKTLFGAEGAIFLLTLPTGPRVVTDLEDSAIATYFAHYAHLDVAPAMLEQLSEPFALEEDAQQTPLYTRHVTGEAFNEWYRPLGMDRTISLRSYGRHDGVPSMAAPGFSGELVANVILGGSTAARGRRLGPARTLLALLQPALAAGARALQQAFVLPGGDRPSSFASPYVSVALDGLDAPVWLFDEVGRFLYQSAAASRLTMRLVEGDVLRAATEQHARALLRGWRTGQPVHATWALEVSGERLRLVGSYLRPKESQAPAVLVRAEGVLASLPSEEAVRGRFGLTPQETRVAFMRARGVSTGTIAERLSVSVHTVRRHTEHVMAKLHVRRAAEIGPRLLALGDGEAEAAP